MIKLNKVFLVAFLFFLSATVVFSHPHIFIDASLTFEFHDRELTGIRVRWLFDEMFSASIIMDFDTDRNRTLSAREIKAIELGAFSNLKNFHYFLHLEIDGLKRVAGNVAEFNAEIVSTQLVYQFFVPLHVSAGADDKLIRAACFDDTYFCDVKYTPQSPVAIKNGEACSCTWEFVAEPRCAYWGGMIIPEFVVLTFTKKD